MDATRFGNKAAGLARLAALGYPVPEGFCLPTDANAEAAREEILRVLENLAVPWAVRSSSTAEDAPTTAYPGIFDTILGLVEPERVIAAVLKVRAGASSARANEYARRHAIAPESMGMSVLIQRLVDADIAGTAFTRDPFDGSNIVVIESTYGLGETLVSGEVTPDRILVSPDGEIKVREVGTKSVTKVRNEEGVFSMETPQPLRARLSMDDETAKAIARMARQIESDLGGPQDIEWAVDREGLHILQARPITTLLNERTTPQALALKTVTSNNDWEYYVTRDFCWLIEKTQIAATDKALHLATLGFPYPLERYVIVNGDEYGCSANNLVLCEVLAQYESDRSGFFTNYAETLRGLAITAREAARKMLSEDMSSFSTAALVAQIHDFARVYTLSFIPTWTRPDYYLETKTRAILGSLNETTVAELFYAVARSVDLDSLESSREPIDLLRLNQVHFSGVELPPDPESLPMVQRRVLSEHASKYGWQRSPLSSSLDTYGERDYLARIRLTREKGLDPSDEIRRIEQERRVAAEFVQSTLARLPDASNARRAVETMQNFIYLRTFTTEASDYLFFAGKQRLWKEVSRRLEVPLEVVLMCSPGEIAAALLGSSSTNEMQDLARERQRGFAIVWSEGVPVTVFGRSVDAINSKIRVARDFAAPTHAAGSTVVGQPASPGRAYGRAKIILSGDDGEEMKLGDVLVTSMTNPDLVFAMEKASAIVTDEGGVTCHAAITARELGVPCVIGTGNATRLIPDGAFVKVDADAGTVEIEPASGSSGGVSPA
jgi:pyruvate,water dikinase